MVYPAASRLSPLALLLAVAACATPPAVERGPHDVAFLQACKDATSDGMVLNLAAHPDDEAARTLVYLRRKHGIRTVTVYSTCGQGGQNAIGREIGPALAFLRTRETLAAARFTGTEVRWLGFEDFGYSKTAEEAFAVWGKDEYLRRLEAIVDAEHPDIIFTNHSPSRGHGHHRASVIGVRELMERKAAGGWVVPVFQRGWNDQESSQVEFPVGEIDPIAGESYGRQAHRGWLQHRTQGPFGPFSGTRLRADKWGIVHPKGGDGTRPLAVVGSVFGEKEFVQVASEAGIDIAELHARFDAFGDLGQPRSAHVDRARELLPDMVRLRANLAEGPAALRLDRRIDALQRVVMYGQGFSIAAQLSQERLALGSTGFIYLQVQREGSVPPPRVHAALPGGPEVAGVEGQLRLPFGPLEDVRAGDVRPGWFHPRVTFDVDGVVISRTVPVRYTPVERVALRLQRDVHMVPAGSTGGHIEVPLEITWNGDTEVAAPIELAASGGVVAELDQEQVKLPARPTRTSRLVRITLPDAALRGDATVETRLASGSTRLLLRLVDCRPPADLSVGLIRGPDDTLQRAFEDLKIAHQVLDPETLASADLSRFTTLVLDIRVYYHRKDLSKQRDRILAFCRAGGRVVSFYHKPQEWNPNPRRPLMAPYELSVGSQRVCEEDAAVTFLKPGHRLFTYPNRLAAADFADWVQERGLNFPATWGGEWTPLLQMHDRGEKPLKGALLYAAYEKGDYVYCSLALYRQLRRGHAGAARILVNLLSK